MRFAGGGIVRHLGYQSYKGGAVAALSELIANAWDADATEVRIHIPLGTSLKPTDVITVKDNGCGMNWNECNEKYLVIGRDRRVAESRDVSPSGRPLMAHKGLGKLAGFGIAKIVEIKTVKNKKLTHFVMDFLEMDKLNQGENYQPKMIADEEETGLENNTEVVLRDLTLERAISKDVFFSSMAARFAVLSDTFRVYINDELLKKELMPTEFRFPKEVGEDVVEIVDGWGVTNLPPRIRWWIGFTEKPIQMEGMRGVSVLTRGKLSQEPWDFELSGGAHGQFGLQYLTGEIVADFLDEGIEKVNDLIITNRSSVMWEHLKAKPLYDWARKKIRDLLSKWADARSEKTVEKVTRKYPDLIKKIAQFQPREQKELKVAMKKLAEVETIEPERLATLFGYVIDGYKDKVFVDMLEEIKNLPPEERVKMLDVLREFDVSEAVRVYRIVSSHVRVIQAFREMIEAGVPEKPNMHEHISKYPWLLGLKFQSMDHDKSLQRVLEERFGIRVENGSGKGRPDFVCLRSGGDVLVVELKRPGETVEIGELNQISGYVDYLRDWVITTTTDKLGLKNRPENITGYLIAYDVRDDPSVRRGIKRLEQDHIYTCKWDDLLMRAEDDHRVFLEIVKGRAPKDDPRVAEIEEKGIV